MSTRRRRGVALPLALAGVVLIGVLAASSLFLAGQERRAGESASLAEGALAAAELGLGAAISDWDRAAASALPIGASIALGSPAEGTGVETTLTRLAERVFWVVSEGRATRGHRWARRRINMVLRIAVPAIGVAGALTSAQPVVLAAGSIASGDLTEACGPTVESPAAAAGIVVTALDDAQGDLTGVRGEPPVAADRAAIADLAALFATGSPSHRALVERAAVTLPPDASPAPARPVATAGECDLSISTNWGEPRGTGGVPPCERYLPIVHAQGDLRLEGAHRGQGILLVDGSLRVEGSLEYRGLLLVRGRLDAPGALQLVGAALLQGGDATGAPSWLGAGSVVQYGQCAIHRALTAAGHPRVARERGWADLH